MLMAVMMATKIVAPNIWGWIADHSGARVRIIRVGTLCAMLSYSLLLVVTGYWWMMVVLAFFSFFWNAALPQFEATTMTHLGDGTHHYSKIRVWGSIGFIVSVLALAPLFERVSIRWLPVIVLILLICLWVNTLTVNEGHREQHTKDHVPLIQVLVRPPVLCLLLVCFLAQASHGPYYAFFSIYLETHGYARDMIGLLWALGVVAEVLVFLVMHRWLVSYGVRNLLLVALAVTAVRWLLIATEVQSLPILVVAQLMHAASFGLLHACAIQFVHRFFPGRLQGRGQALYSSLSFGLGGATGSLLSGYVWSVLGPQWIYYMGALLASIGLVVAWKGVRLAPSVQSLKERQSLEGLS